MPLTIWSLWLCRSGDDPSSSSHSDIGACGSSDNGISDGPAVDQASHGDMSGSSSELDKLAADGATGNDEDAAQSGDSGSASPDSDEGADGISIDGGGSAGSDGSGGDSHLSDNDSDSSSMSEGPHGAEW